MSEPTVAIIAPLTTSKIDAPETWDTWTEAFHQLKIYAETNGDSHVPLQYEQNGWRLGYWVDAQKEWRQNLSEAQQEKLESLPEWTWDRYHPPIFLEPIFTKAGEEPPTEIPEAEPVARIRESPPPIRLWEERFQQLKDFAQQNGHAQVPYLHIQDDFGLGRWVATQRRRRSDLELSQEQEQKLEGLPGWTWETVKLPENSTYATPDETPEETPSQTDSLESRKEDPEFSVQKITPSTSNNSESLPVDLEDKSLGKVTATAERSKASEPNSIKESAGKTSKPAAAIKDEYILSSWGKRVAASILDLVFLFLISLPVAFISGVLKAPAVYWLFFFLSFIVYSFVSLTRKGIRNGQTLGKQWVGITVIRDDKKPIDKTTVFLREGLIKEVLGIFTLGLFWVPDCLWPLGDPGNRALHDHGVGTHVTDTGLSENSHMPKFSTPSTKEHP